MFPFDFLGFSSDDVVLDPISQSPEAEPETMYPESRVLINHGTREVLSPGEIWEDNMGDIYRDSEDYGEGKNPLRGDPLAAPGQTNVTLYRAEELGHFSPLPDQAVNADLAVNEVAADASNVDSDTATNAGGNDYDTVAVAAVSYDTSSSDWSSSTSSNDSLDSGWDSSSSDWSSDSDYGSSCDYESSSDW